LLLHNLPEFLASLNERDHIALLGDPALHVCINDVIDVTGRREKRKRRLSACLTMYIVLSLSLFRRLSIPNALATLLSCLRDVIPGLPYRPASEGAICDARYRLGEAPLKALFEARAATVAPPPTFRGLRVWAIDGVRFQVPDTEDNLGEFGKPIVGRGSSAFPVARVVALVDTHGHRVRAINIDRWDAAERDAVEQLIESLDDEDVVLLDRGFPSGPLFRLFGTRRVHVVCRITSTWRPRLVKKLGLGDYLVRITVKTTLPSSTTAGGNPPQRNSYILMRMLVYRCGKQESRILTDLTDAASYPALDLASLYHERWEVELVYDEVKNHFATGLTGSLDLCVRSKLPCGVRQELYAMFTAYNFVRTIIVAAAKTHDLQPLEISFVGALAALQITIPRIVAATADEQQILLRRILSDIAKFCRLRPRRKRQYDRKVKVKMSDFGCKTASDVQRKEDLRPAMCEQSVKKTWSRRRKPDPAPHRA
jgi:hypothetical protein